MKKLESIKLYAVFLVPWVISVIMGISLILILSIVALIWSAIITPITWKEFEIEVAWIINHFMSI